ncbi:MAG: metallophosphoesterase family protein [Treponema sp.]|nr:metallophosphoesterase family protein [Treponema sp.]
MKLLLLSDIHGNLENLDKLDSEFSSSDAVIMAGDFAECFKTETAKPVLDKLVTKHDSIFAVLGNCDDPEFIEDLENNDISCERSLVFHDGIAFAGSGGGSVFTKKTPNERTEEDLQSDFQIVENSADSCADQNGCWNDLILVSHNPPKGTKCDKVAPGVHAGSQSFTDYIKKRQPVLVVTGHIHEGCAIDRIDNTTVINPGSLAEGKYAVVELEKNNGSFEIKTAVLKNL